MSLDIHEIISTTHRTFATLLGINQCKRYFCNEIRYANSSCVLFSHIIPSVVHCFTSYNRQQSAQALPAPPKLFIHSQINMSEFAIPDNVKEVLARLSVADQGASLCVFLLVLYAFVRLMKEIDITVLRHHTCC
jgi:hypothetical protein